MTNKNIRFMTNQYLTSSFTYSSQITAFPASNITNQSRSKTWRPGGNFEVTTANQNIYINDGTDKTVALTVGAYTYSTLATHIQTALNAASSNWTCTYSTTTNKFTIGRSGSGTLRQSQTTNAAWSMLGYTFGSDVTGTSFVADEQRIHTSEWLKCDMGVGQRATFAALIPAIETSLPLTETASVKIQANNIDLWTAPPLDLALTVNDVAAMRFISETESEADYRYWRLVITDPQNYRGPLGLEFGYAYIGDYQTVTATNIQVGFQKSFEDPSVVQESETGVRYIEERPRFMTVSNSEIALLNGTEFDELEQLFYDVGIRRAFFVSLDPTLMVSRKLSDLTRYMIMDTVPSANHVIRDYYNVSFSMREAF
jgi:hypothetical protein